MGEGEAVLLYTASPGWCLLMVKYCLDVKAWEEKENRGEIIAPLLSPSFLPTHRSGGGWLEENLSKSDFCPIVAVAAIFLRRREREEAGRDDGEKERGRRRERSRQASTTGAVFLIPPFLRFFCPLLSNFLLVLSLRELVAQIADISSTSMYRKYSLMVITSSNLFAEKAFFRPAPVSTFYRTMYYR